MTILFSWLSDEILTDFRNHLNPKQQRFMNEHLESNREILESDDIPILEQSFFEQVFLFCYNKPPLEKELNTWLSPNVKIICLDMPPDSQYKTIYNTVLKKIKKHTHNFKYNCRLLSTIKHDKTVKIFENIKDKYKLPEMSYQNGTFKDTSTDNSKKSINKPSGFENIISLNPNVHSAVARAAIAAKQSCYPVLITGESGTGKKYLIEDIYKVNNIYPVFMNFFEIPEVNIREFEQKLAIDCHEKDCTLILENIDQCNLREQLMLLKIVNRYKSGRFQSLNLKHNSRMSCGIKIIATTTRNLLETLRLNRFLPELYYKLAAINIELPPLRDRHEDILLLAKHFLRQANQLQPEGNTGYTYKYLSQRAQKTLLQHAWPGNIDELKMVINQAVLFSESNIIESKDLSITSTENLFLFDTFRKPIGRNFNLNTEIEAIQKRYISRALKQADNNKAAAARLLGFKSYQALDSRMNSLHINPLGKSIRTKEIIESELESAPKTNKTKKKADKSKKGRKAKPSK